MISNNYIRLQNVRGVGPKRLENIIAKLKETNRTLDDLFAMPAPAIVEQFKLPKNVAESIAKAPEFKPEESEEEQLTNRGIRQLIRGTTGYPIRLGEVLGEKAPTILYVWGNTELLTKPTVGFCGSRNVTDKGIDVTIDTAQQIVEQGWVVVSGHARGVDVAAHRTALLNNGGTIIVAPQGILDFKLRQELKRIAKPEQILIISEFPPKAGWTVINAMSRNKTIIGLSDAMIVVEARLEGGTFEAGKTALRLNVPLYVAQYQSPGDSAAGNEYFLKKGANSILKNKESGKARIDSLLEEISRKKELPSLNEMSKAPIEIKEEQLTLI